MKVIRSKFFIVAVAFLPVAGICATLSGVLSGTAPTEIFTVESSGQFRLVFESDDNWGLSQWYDLNNDPSATTNLAGPAYSVSGPGTPCAAEPGLANITYYAVSDAKQFMRQIGCVYPSTPRAFTVLQNTADMIVVESSGNPVSFTTAPDPSVSVKVRYYILPTGKIYLRKSITAGSAGLDLGAGSADLFIGTLGLQDPTQTGTIPPDTQGWIRASTEQNPYSYEDHGDSATFAYWAQNSPSPYTHWTHASIVEAWSPNNSESNAVYRQIQHSWGDGAGNGVVRWGYRISPGPVIAANATKTYEFLIQLGSENSSVLPNIVTSSTATTISSAFIAAPTFPDIASASTPATIKGRGTFSGRGRGMTR